MGHVASGCLSVTIIGYLLIAIGNYSRLPCYLQLMPVRDYYCPVAQVTDGYCDCHWKLWRVTLLPGYLRIMPVHDHYCPVAQVTDGYWLIAAVGYLVTWLPAYNACPWLLLSCGPGYRWLLADCHWKLWRVTLLPGYLHILPFPNGYWRWWSRNVHCWVTMLPSSLVTLVTGHEFWIYQATTEFLGNACSQYFFLVALARYVSGGEHPLAS